MPVTAKEIAENTEKDEQLKTLLHGLTTGKSVEKEKRFNIDQNEFALQKGCILRGIRVVIPAICRKKVLMELHTGHFGVNRMKALARGFCWWPGIDHDIEQLTQNCRECRNNANNPIKVNHPWNQPNSPFERIHLDFAGPFLGAYFLILVDAYSKWPEIHTIKHINTQETIKILQKIFATFGVPRVICTDNGTQFVNPTFKSYLNSFGIIHKRTAPYHPATNGQAERYVQTLKRKLSALKADRQDLDTKIQTILFQYRITPHSVTKVSPAELIFKFPLYTKYHLMIPEQRTYTPRVEQTETKVRKFHLGERAAARNYLGKEKWQLGKVCGKDGKLHYQVELDDGRTWRRHVDQLRKTGEDVRGDPQSDSGVDPNQEKQLESPPNEESSKNFVNNEFEKTNINTEFKVEESNKQNNEIRKEIDVELRRSTRVKKPVDRLQYYC